MSIDDSAAAKPVDGYPALAVDGYPPLAVGAPPPLLGAAEARATIGATAAGACAGEGWKPADGADGSAACGCARAGWKPADGAGACGCARAGAGAGAAPLAAALHGMGGYPSNASAGLAAAVEGG